MTRQDTAPVYGYPMTWKQWEPLLSHPRISADFALDKGLWDGRKVAVIAISRGTHRRRTERRVYYGWLDLSAGDANQIGVRHADGHVSIIHKSRAVDIHDVTRTKAAK